MDFPGDLLKNFETIGPCSTESFQGVDSHFGCSMPLEYRAFMECYGGGEGFVGKQYLVLWKIQELISFNREYEVGKYAPGLVLFGSNGGGEAFAFDTKDAKLPIVMVPFIGMSRQDALPVADTFDAFLRKIAQ